MRLRLLAACIGATAILSLLACTSDDTATTSPTLAPEQRDQVFDDMLDLITDGLYEPTATEVAEASAYGTVSLSEAMWLTDWMAGENTEYGMGRCVWDAEVTAHGIIAWIQTVDTDTDPLHDSVSDCLSGVHQ